MRDQESNCIIPPFTSDCHESTKYGIIIDKFVLIFLLFASSIPSVAKIPGALKWSVQAGSSTSELAVSHSGDIIINTRGLLCLDPSGNEKWRYQIPKVDGIYQLQYVSEYLKPVISRTGTVFIFVENDVFGWWLYALDQNGKFIWEYAIGSIGDFRTPAPLTLLANNTLCVGLNKTPFELLLLNSAGKLLKKICYDIHLSTLGSIVLSPYIASDQHNNIYVHTHHLENREVEYGFLSFDSLLNLNWKNTSTGIGIYPSPFILDHTGLIYMNVWGPWHSRSSYRLNCIDPYGRIIASLDGKYDFIVMDKSGQLFAVNQNALLIISNYLQKVHKVNLSSPISSPLIIGNSEVLYFACEDKSVNAYSIQNRRLLWSYRTRDVVTLSPTMDSSGTLYVLDKRGYLYALETESTNLDLVNWPKVSHDAQNTVCNVDRTDPDWEHQNRPPPVDKFDLFQNYPNPFNEITIIPFELNTTQQVTLTIANMNGKTVILEQLGALIPGGHQFIWNGKDRTGNRVSSGVYLYKLDAGAFHSARKMLLLH